MQNNALFKPKENAVKDYLLNDLNIFMITQNKSPLPNDFQLGFCNPPSPSLIFVNLPQVSTLQYALDVMGSPEWELGIFHF